MAQKTTTLRPPPKTRLVNNGRVSAKRRGGAPKGGYGISTDDAEKFVRRYVNWLRNATPKQRDMFIERVCDGLQTLPARQAVREMRTLKLVVLAVGPVSANHAAVCNTSGQCDICENLTLHTPMTNKICCTRGPDDHSVVFN